jgi:hypothetical protein
MMHLPPPAIDATKQPAGADGKLACLSFDTEPAAFAASQLSWWIACRAAERDGASPYNATLAGNGEESLRQKNR